MGEKGWHEKASVKILKGKWQDVLSSDEFLGLGKFDAIYTDTFAENYDGGHGVARQHMALNVFAELRRFFKRLPDLLDGPDARFSFFNGLVATSMSEFSLPLDTEQTHLDALFYDIYTHVSDCHLSEVGADVQWHDVDVGRLDGAEDDERWGGTRKYFTLPIYRLPIAQLKGD